MLQKRLNTTLLLAAVLSMTAACGGGDPSGPGGEALEPGLHVVAGADLADTAWATPVQALTVRVVGPDGKVMPGLVVRFESGTVRGRFGPVPSVLVTDIASNSFNLFAADTTDAEGRASVRVRMGEVAGPGLVMVGIPDLGLQDTVRYTIRPGAAVRLVSAPEDSAVYVGRSYPLRATVMDRYGNARSDAVTYTTASPQVTLNGATVGGAAVGRGMVVAQSQGLADTSYVSVVPEGTIAAYTVQGSSTGGLAVYTMNLDGSDLRERVKSTIGGGYFGEMPAAWSPDGKTLVYHDNRYDHTRQLYTLDLATGTTTRLVSAPGTIASEAWPQRSRDGQWIYYNGQVAWGGSMLYRVRPDGSGMAQVATGWNGNAGYPSPSPDGTRLAYVTNRDYQGGGLEILDLRTSQNSVLKVRAGTPRWSPSGDLIAFVAQENIGSYFDHHNMFVSGELRVVRPDGTGMRTVTRTAVPFGPGIDWSPDGKYLVGVSQGVLTVVDVASGEQVPIRLGKTFVAPVWRP